MLHALSGSLSRDSNPLQVLLSRKGSKYSLADHTKRCQHSELSPLTNYTGKREAPAVESKKEPGHSWSLLDEQKPGPGDQTMLRWPHLCSSASEGNLATLGKSQNGMLEAYIYIKFENVMCPTEKDLLPGINALGLLNSWTSKVLNILFHQLRLRLG